LIRRLRRRADDEDTAGEAEVADERTD
jgi:hypothetical protein